MRRCDTQDPRDLMRAHAAAQRRIDVVRGAVLLGGWLLLAGAAAVGVLTR